MSYRFKEGDLVVIKSTSQFAHQNSKDSTGKIIVPKIITSAPKEIPHDRNSYQYALKCRLTGNQNSYRYSDLELSKELKHRYKKKNKKNIIVAFESLPKILEDLSKDPFSKILPSLKKPIGKTILSKLMNDDLSSNKKVICYEVTPKEYLIIKTKLYTDIATGKLIKYSDKIMISHFHTLNYFKEC